ncbi:hypothetical protein, partial [Serratia sp. ME43]|uniref:hypothetical protein n=1 Tax=Serratia sp. ME43 TaxID=2744256 RepID=UPI001C7172BE
RRAIFTQRHQQDGAFVGSGQAHISLLIHWRITRATTRGSLSSRNGASSAVAVSLFPEFQLALRRPFAGRRA